MTDTRTDGEVLHDEWIGPPSYTLPPLVEDKGEKPYHGIVPPQHRLEADPTGRAANEPGSKLDAGKEPVLRGAFEYFPRALLAVAGVSAFGASKYTWRGWEGVPDGVNRYGDALARHLLKERIEGECDRDSGLLHAAHAAWNALARLEMVLREKEIAA